MISWLRAWVKSWWEVRKMRRSEQYRKYYNEYIERASKRWEEESREAHIYLLAVTLMQIAQFAGVLVWVFGCVAALWQLVVCGALFEVGAALSLRFLLETGRVQDEARTYAIDRMRGD